MKTETFKKTILAGIVSALVGLTSGAQAATFSVTGYLTGDVRDYNPDNLIVDVTINVTDNTANWLVDINSPLHEDIKLDEFYFNLAYLTAADITFSAFDPAGWAINNPATVQGAGGARFMFEALDTANGNDRIYVTNDQDLTFTATLNRPWTLEDFLDATTAQSNDAGSGQMGAHLQSLTIAGNCDGLLGTGLLCSDSGFAFGNYEGDDGGGQQDIPEPAMSALMGIGFLSLALAYVRRVPS